MLVEHTSSLGTQSTAAPPIVDAVICWVDGQDADHQKEREFYLKQSKRNVAQEVNAPRRWSDSNEIEVCLRSLDRHGQFLRHIFLVTNGQLPDCLAYLPEGVRQKIRLVDHDELFEATQALRPNFNSIAIETMLWRIGGLSEHFIYFNDDQFLCGPCGPDDFFRGEATAIAGNWMRFPNWFEDIFREKIYRSAMLNGARANGFNRDRFFVPSHVATPMRVSVLRKLFEEKPDVLRINTQSRFRHHGQYLVQSLFVHAVIKSGKFFRTRRRISIHISALSCRIMPWWILRLHLRLARFPSRRCKLVCVNDLALLNSRFGPKAERLFIAFIGLDTSAQRQSDPVSWAANQETNIQGLAAE